MKKKYIQFSLFVFVISVMLSIYFYRIITLREKYKEQPTIIYHTGEFAAYDDSVSFDNIDAGDLSIKVENPRIIDLKNYFQKEHIKTDIAISMMKSTPKAVMLDIYYKNNSKTKYYNDIRKLEFGLEIEDMTFNPISGFTIGKCPIPISIPPKKVFHDTLVFPPYYEYCTKDKLDKMYLIFTASPIEKKIKLDFNKNKEHL